VDEVAERFSAKFFYDQTCDGVATAAIDKICLRIEVERFHPFGQTHKVIPSDEIIVEVPAGHRYQSVLVPNPTHMSKHLANAHGSRKSKFGNVSANIVVERQEFVPLDEQHEGHSCELLSQGGGLKNCARRDRDIMIEICHSVSASIDDFAMFDQRDGTAGPVVVELAKDLINPMAGEAISREPLRVTHQGRE
jgi:hypothetical protein